MKNSKEIIYTTHLETRLKLRDIPATYPRLIYTNPEQKFFDTLQTTLIAVKKLWYNKKKRYLMIAYTETNSQVKIFTCHPISETKIVNRVISGRWQII